MDFDREWKFLFPHQRLHPTSELFCGSLNVQSSVHQNKIILIQGLLQLILVVLLKLLDCANFLNSQIGLFYHSLKFPSLSFLDEKENIYLLDLVWQRNLDQGLTAQGCAFGGRVVDFNSLVELYIQK